MAKQNKDGRDRDYTLREAEKIQSEEYRDDADFAARFAFSPSLEKHGFEKDKFKQINKNLVLTHLSEEEVKEAQQHLDAIQVLMNFNETKHYLLLQNGDQKPISKHLAREYNEEGYKVLRETENRYQNVVDWRVGKLFGLTSTASGANSALLKRWKERRVQQRQTIREEHEPDQYFSNILQKNNKQRR